jgi:vancomycin resistance protein YoaR
MIGPWTISADQIAASLRVEQTVGADGLRTYDVSVDFSGFAAYLRELAPGLLTAPQDGRFDFDETTRQIAVIQPSSGGRSLNVEATIARMEEQVFSTTDRSVAMVYDYTPARYHDGVTAAELGITELIGEATTYYRGSQANRRTNIAVSVSRFDGVTIGPGEEFSFNTLLGEISPEAGFLEDNLIFGGRTILGIGGGVCQVSTTAFRAAFYAGYTIIERNSHGYRVGYYEQNGQPPGLDAAIWQPERDFRFQNDTPYHLLIEVDIYPADDALQFRLYSTPTGRTVEVETPRVSNLVPPVPDRFEVNNDLRPGEILQVDYSAQGADVNVTRTITYPDGTVKKDNIFTHYLPWGAIYQVAPGDSRLSS